MDRADQPTTPATLRRPRASNRTRPTIAVRGHPPTQNRSRPMRTPRFLLATSLTAVVVLAGCTSDGDESPDAVGTEQPAEGDTADATPSDPESTETEEETDEPDPSPTATDDDGAPPLAGDPATDPAQADPDWGGMLAVSDVRVATHDGFDRVVFDIAGDDGGIGWDVRYVDVPTSQGSGNEAEVDGEAYLAVSISGVALPPELPPEIEAFTGEVEGPADGGVVEVVHDSIFEGYHLFFVGVDTEMPYVVERLEDPQRLVIDLHHDRA